MQNYFETVLKSFKENWVQMLVVALVVGIGFAIDSIMSTAMSGVSLAAAGASVYRNAQVVDGASWESQFRLTAAAAAKLENVMIIGSDGNQKVIAWYNHADTFATDKALYDSLPVGSMVMDIIAGKDYMHQTATTWKANTYA